LVKFIDALPKSGSGKILWRVLQEREQEKMSAVSGILNWMNEPTKGATRTPGGKLNAEKLRR
jgi:acyl-CoA synthetase (AMP-forming)/AMP-acid ligase II